MAKKDTTSGADQAAPAPEAVIDDAAYYRVDAAGRFKAFGIGFGALSDTQVTGEVLRKLMASEFADKVTGYTAV